MNKQTPTLPRVIQAMLNPDRYAHAVTSVALLETHISWVLLAGDYAYKIKKPVNFGFLDYSTLARRKQFCEAEVELNQRFAPDLYIDVIAIGAPADAPLLGATTEIIEYAVRMHRFGDDAVLAQRADLAQLDTKLLDEFAAALATIHADAPRRPEFGGAEQVMAPVRDSLADLRRYAPASEGAWIEQLAAAMEREYTTLQPLLQSRTSQIRECHGDLHLGNVALIDGKLCAFDGIEFNDALRCIDPMSDLAFLLMDLHERGWPEQANRLLTIYTEHAGDYAGLATLRFYRAYRALVRAKVAALRRHADDTQLQHSTECRKYLQEAQQSLAPARPFVLITRGLSGSGKSYLALALAAHLGAIRLRSDRERKRLAEETYSHLPLYDPHMSQHTYRQLNRLAKEITAAGFPVILDATFLDVSQLEAVVTTAAGLGIPLASIECHAPVALMQQRLDIRARRDNDPSDADRSVLAKQLTAPPIEPGNLLNELRLDTSRDDALVLAERWVRHQFYSF